jgi:glycosyltransferase involved in cell wall biosynthesis
MTRVLFLAYYFPPAGGGGAQRPARFVHHLDELGHSPVVVAASGAVSDRWAPPDASLLEIVPTAVEVRRTTSEPPRASPRRELVERWLRRRSRWADWWIREAVARGTEFDDVDVVYAIMPPYATAEVASRLARALSRPWIADLGDPWALDEMMLYPSALHRRLEIRHMRRMLRTAAAVVTTTNEAAQRIRSAFPELADRPVVSIPMGYAEQDFARLVPSRSDGAFRIVHTGSLHTDLGREQRQPARRLLRGGMAGVDIMTRSHMYLLMAVEHLVASDVRLAARIEVHLAGVLSDNDRRIASRYEFVRLHGYLPHDETIALIRSADLLFLPMQNLPSGRRSATVPGKTYEYLASRKPVLAAVPEGDARDTLLRAGTAHICAPDDTDGMAHAIRAELDKAGGLGVRDPDVITTFEYSALTRQAAELIDLVVSPARD